MLTGAPEVAAERMQSLKQYVIFIFLFFTFLLSCCLVQLSHLRLLLHVNGGFMDNAVLHVPEGAFIANVAFPNSKFFRVCSTLSDAIDSCNDILELTSLWTDIDCFVTQVRSEGEVVVFNVR